MGGVRGGNQGPKKAPPRLGGRGGGGGGGQVHLDFFRTLFGRRTLLICYLDRAFFSYFLTRNGRFCDFEFEMLIL